MMILTLAASLVAFMSSPAAAGKPKPLLSKFSSLVVFGDSYTADGVLSYTPPVTAQGTNESTGGRVWPQYIQQYAGINLYDYAHAGDVCDVALSDSGAKSIKQYQMPSFLADNEWRNSTTGASALINPVEETICTIWIGTNDLSNSGFLTDVLPGIPMTNYTDCIYQQFDTLYAMGARYFVLLNNAPLDLTPQYALPWRGGLDSPEFWLNKLAYDPNITQSSEKMRQYVTLTNSVFDYKTPYDTLIANRYPKATMALYDVHSLITDIYFNPENYLNGTAPYNVTSSIYRCGAPCASEDVRDSYLWNNDLHPSEQTDRIIAREFVKLVNGESKWATYWRS